MVLYGFSGICDISYTISKIRVYVMILFLWDPTPLLLWLLIVGKSNHIHIYAPQSDTIEPN